MTSVSCSDRLTINVSEGQEFEREAYKFQSIGVGVGPHKLIDVPIRHPL